MRRAKSSLSVMLAVCLLVSMFGPIAALAQPDGAASVLVFHDGSATATAAVDAIEDFADGGGFAVTTTDDPGAFTAGGLAAHRAVVFAPMSGNNLDTAQRSALQQFVTSGGGFVAMNTAAGAESNWNWYGSELIGARPGNGPSQAQQATVEQADANHPATRDLPLEWEHDEIWLNYSPNPSGDVHTVLRVRERDYTGGAMGVDHPIAWCQNVDDGRSFYTGLGSTTSAYGEANLQDHLLGAIQWAAGLVRGDCEAGIDDNYQAERLTQPNSPGQLDQYGEMHGISIAEDGRVFYIGRGGGATQITDWSHPDTGLGAGTVHVWDPATEQVTHVGTLDVFGNRGGSGTDRSEEGLVGIAVDPDFLDNGWIYLHYTPHEKLDAPARRAVRQVSRFTVDLDTNQMDLDSEQVLLEWEVQVERCCHAGGDMKFDPDGNLYIATGDTNSSEFTGGYSGNHPGVVGNVGAGAHADARRTAGNTNNLNGKILRITPTDEGGYTIPDDNLFPPEEYEGQPARPEIFVMGTRNPSRMAIDSATGYVHSGVVGPDAGNPSSTWGPAKYDWFSVHTEAGNQGWPFCVGDRQPYRDRNAQGQALDWYDCDNLVNDSPNNTGLTNIPPQNPQTLWYSPQGGGPVFPRDSEGIPSYQNSQSTLTQPYLNGGGAQAAMGGPIYRYQDSYADSDIAWPEYWEGKWFIGDFYSNRVRNAVVLDPDTVADGGAPTHAENLRGKIPTGSVQNLHGWEFGPDGALYLLDYGAGAWFSVASGTALWRVTYTGGSATPAPTGTASPDQGDAPLEVSFSSEGSGGVSVVWDFGDGNTSIEPNPTHTYGTTGQYTATLTVEYADGETVVVEVPVTVGTPPEVDLDAPVEGGMFDWGDTLPFAVDVTADADAVECDDVSVTSRVGSEALDTVADCEGLIGTGSGARLDPRATISATYTIDGEGDDPEQSPGLSGTAEVGVLSKHLQAEDADARPGTSVISHAGAEGGQRVSGVDDGEWLRFDDVNLAQIDSVIFRAASPTYGGVIELRSGDPDDGELIASADVGATEDADTYGIVSAAVADPGGTNDLYVVFRAYEDNAGGSDLFDLDALYFYGDGSANPEAQFDVLFDGTQETYDNWESVGAGNWTFDEEEGTITPLPAGTGCCGLFWYPDQEYEDFVLKLEWRDDREGSAYSNSGVFVRFPDTGSSTATTAINQGHEIQIYDGPTGEPQKTGSIYNHEPLNIEQANPTPKGEWNDYEIRVVNQVYTVIRNGEVINRYDNTSAARGLSGHFGLQWHDDQSVVSFRNVRIKEVVGPEGGFMSTPPSPLPPPPPTEPHPDSILNTIGITLEENAPNATIRLVTSWAAELLPAPYSVTVPDLLAPNGPPLRMTDTSGVYPNVATAQGQTYEIPVPEQDTYDTVHVFGAGSDGQGTGTFTLNYTDGSSDTADVHFPDWANPNNMNAPTQEAFSGMAYRHRADGMGNISGQYRETLPGGLLMRLYHHPMQADASKTLESITLPQDPSGNLAFQIFGLTFEADGEYLAADLYRVPDNDPPEVTAAVSGGVGSATVTLFASDELSGIEGVEYAIDGGDWTEYEGWIQLDDTGTYDVAYRATDGNLNVSDPQSVEVEVSAAAELEPDEGSVLDMIGITDFDHRFDGEVETSGTSWRAQTLPDAHSVTTSNIESAYEVPWRMPDTSGAYANTSRANGQMYVLPEEARQNYDTVHVLNGASNGPRSGTFTLTYTDGSTDDVTLTSHDWANPSQMAPPTEEAYTGLGPERHIGGGSGSQTLPSNLQMRIYRTPLEADPTKALESVTFAPKPGSWNSNQNIVVIGVTMEADGNFFPADLYEVNEPSVPTDPDPDPDPPTLPVCPGDLSDYFDGDALDRDRWTQIVREGDGEIRVQDGHLLLPTNPGDLQSTSDPLASNLVFQPVPGDEFRAQTRITIDATQNGHQAGIMLYGDDGDWAKIAFKRHGGGDLGIEFIRAYDGEIDLDFGQDIAFMDVPETFDFRMDSDGEEVWGEYSFDNGETWESVGRRHPVAGINDPHIGLFALSSPSAAVIDAAFDHFLLLPDPTAVVDPNDEFDGDELDRCRWTNIVREDPETYEVSDGALRITTVNGDLSGGANDATNVITQPVSGAFEAGAEITFAPSDGSMQAGVMVYGDDDNYAKLGRLGRNGANWFEFIEEVDGTLRFGGEVDRTPDLAGDFPDSFEVKVMVDEDQQVTGAYSIDGGATWIDVGRPADLSGVENLHVGVFAWTNDSDHVGEAVFERFWLDDGSEPSEVTATLDPAEPDGNEDWYVSPVTLTLESDDPGAQLQWRQSGEEAWSAYGSPVTFDEDGEYDIEYSADDGGSGGPTDVPVRVGDGGFTYTPDEIHATVGDTIVYELFGGTHDVITLDADTNRVGASPLLTTEGETYEFEAVEPGTYYIYCTPHSNGPGVEGSGDPTSLSGMVGTVHIAPADDGGDEPEIGEVSFKIDQTAPETDASIEGEQEVTLTLDANDATSGVAETQWRVAGASDHEVYDAPITFDEPGSTTIEYRSVDVAGNVEDWQEIVIEVADDPPPSDIELELTAAPRCIAGKAFVVVTAHNGNDVPVDIEFDSAFGTRAFSGVVPDRFASHAFNTRTANLDDGSITVRVSATVDGVEITEEWTVDFDGLTC